MTTIDHARLRALAEAATPGPWTGSVVRVEKDADGKPRGPGVIRDANGSIVVLSANGPEILVADAAYIAAADPQTMLALLDEIERLRQWKSEAMDVLSEWEKAWIAAGRPGRLGTSKAAGVRDEIERLRGEGEWEYGVRWICLGDAPVTDIGADPRDVAALVEQEADYAQAVRRRKAGPWEPVEGDGDE